MFDDIYISKKKKREKDTYQAFCKLLASSFFF